uniref:F-box domain-containing protein n=1 Tax=Brassica campestris TaxID=3711 RepID=A0A3P6B848_BRACM|nr:unnamed protein product [Brassica rapa]
MDEDREKRHRFKRPSSVDWISSLPDCLLSQILSNLPTKDAVKTSVLSTRWRSLWKQVPSLDLANFDFSLYFPYCPKFLTFVDSFLLDLNRDSCLHEFKLKYDSDGETDHLSRWINTLVKRKVKHIDIVDESNASWDFPIPTTLYSCESLVSLKLSGLTLPNPNLVVSLPSLKTIYLTIAKFDVGEANPAMSGSGKLRFTHLSDCCDDSDEEFVVEIDAPKLEYFRGSIRGREKEGVHILFEPQCFLPSLEYVKIERPLKGEAMEIKLVSYLLENSTILKKLTLLLDVSREREESDILKELLSIPRLSSSCQVVAL